MYHGFDLKRNYLRFRVSPDIAIAIGANAMAAEETITPPIEIMASRHPGVGEQDAYERVNGVLPPGGWADPVMTG